MSISAFSFHVPVRGGRRRVDDVSNADADTAYEHDREPFCRTASIYSGTPYSAFRTPHSALRIPRSAFRTSYSKGTSTWR